ncbi:MAG TPA: FG-GAP-like repeat-containing protein [Terriglobales bacterium]|nr:FG-GAP-like repeat-containing protein [Terriglobales bacterium]
MHRFAHLLTLSFVLVCSTFAQTGFKLQTYSAPNDRHLIARDLTRDGAPDLVIFGGTGLYVRVNSGHGSFGSAQSVAGTYADFAAIADFNNDGLPDIFSCKNNSTGGTRVRIFLNRGGGSFQQSQSISIQKTCVNVVTGDVNGDGKPDVVFGSSTDDTLTTYFGSGTGTVGGAVVQHVNIAAQQNSYITGCGLGAIVGADFKANGKLDLILFGDCSDDPTNAGTLFYAQSDGAGHYSTSEITEDNRSFNYSLPYVADVNGDGKPDVILVDYLIGPHGTFDNNLDFLVNSGNGSFTLKKLFNENLYSASYLSAVFSGAAADFNGDHVYDAAVGFTESPDSCCTPDTPGIAILNGNSTGTYSESQRWKIGGYPYGTVAADFNGDGRPDLAVITHNDSSGANALLVYLNQPASSTCTVPSTAGVHVCSPVAGDTYASPVTVLATGKASSGSVAHMELWIDGKKVGQYSGSQINTTVSLAAGQHRLVVVEVESSGSYIKSSAIYFNVS